MDLKERITDIGKDGDRLFKKKMGVWLHFWIAVAIIIDLFVIWSVWQAASSDAFTFDALEGPLLLMLAPWIFLATLKATLIASIRKNFWKQYAEENGYTYTALEYTKQERGLMFREGHSNHAMNILSGNHAGLPVRFFEYGFTIGHGRGSRSYSYTVFEFRFPGAFPHTYLNYTKDGYNIRPEGELHLPPFLAQKFKLYAPEQYEIEALQIFTPDILALIEDLAWTCDLELIDQELIIYKPGHIFTRGQLDMEFAKAATLAAKLRPTLERMTLAEIGTNKPILRSYTTRQELGRSLTEKS